MVFTIQGLADKPGNVKILHCLHSIVDFRFVNRPEAELCTVILGAIYSSVKFPIYLWLNKQFRQHVYLLLTCSVKSADEDDRQPIDHPNCVGYGDNPAGKSYKVLITEPKKKRAIVPVQPYYINYAAAASASQALGVSMVGPSYDDGSDEVFAPNGDLFSDDEQWIRPVRKGRSVDRPRVPNRHQQVNGTYYSTISGAHIEPRSTRAINRVPRSYQLPKRTHFYENYAMQLEEDYVPQRRFPSTRRAQRLMSNGSTGEWSTATPTKSIPAKPSPRVSTRSSRPTYQRPFQSRTSRERPKSNVRPLSNTKPYQHYSSPKSEYAIRKQYYDTVKPRPKINYISSTDTNTMSTLSRHNSASNKYYVNGRHDRRNLERNSALSGSSVKAWKPGYYDNGTSGLWI